MFKNITLFIPTHNRSFYLKRILEYYASYEIKILIADSSVNAFEINNNKQLIEYIHLPALSLPQKMAAALSFVKTEFVVMCADDDFIVPTGISACLEFLQEHPEFASAQGNCLNYDKKSAQKNEPVFSGTYTDQLSFTITSEDPFERMKDLFNSYRTIFCAVHRTKNLQLAYQKGINIRNLFLNEYLSGIIPVASGKYIELPVFYQVREYADDSGDKTTDNMDVIATDKLYELEYKGWLEYMSNIISGITGKNKLLVFEEVDSIFIRLVEKLRINKEAPSKILVKKRIGKLVAKIPIVGKVIIQKSREAERKAGLRLIIRTEVDRLQLSQIKRIIKEYTDATR